MRSRLSLFLLLLIALRGEALIPDKVLICGIAKNIEKSLENTRTSVKSLSKEFQDYRLIIYENNSTDRSKELLKSWAEENPKMILISEDLSMRTLAKKLGVKDVHRTEVIAYARNRVLDVALSEIYDDFAYVIWADLDFLLPWDVEQIVSTITNPEAEWDAVLANGSYDLFALRDAEFPIGFELLGESYWERLGEIREKLSLAGPWRRVYSAFGGLGIYKRESMRGCRYSGVVTEDVEKMMTQWISPDALFMQEYQEKLKKSEIVQLTSRTPSKHLRLPKGAGVRLLSGKLVWFSCEEKHALPLICEHIPFHAAMAVLGHDKIYINPRLISEHP